MNRRGFLPLLTLPLFGQEKPEWVCPMDADVRSPKPGVCPRCGMKLVPGIPALKEFPLRLEVTPRAWRPGQPVLLRFEILQPDTGERVKRLLMVHERLFHLFLVSGDLEYFAHEHPEPQADGTFLFETTLPKAGMYRLAADYYPEGGTPQHSVKTILSAGSSLNSLRPPKLEASLDPQRAQNLTVELRTEPEAPLAGLKTMLFFRVAPATQLEPYLGAWGHLLAASADLIDLIHAHPFRAGGGEQSQFNITFRRPGMHRLWVQFQRAGKVNTAAFTLPVMEL